MVYWHTAFKRHHSFLIRKLRPFNFFLVGMMFYSVFWYTNRSYQRNFKYIDRDVPSQEKADKNRRMYGYRRHYEPLIARSRKNWLIAQGGYEMRLPFEDFYKADEALKPSQR